MTKTPEYIIGGTKVEVGQVYERRDGSRIVIDKILDGALAIKSCNRYYCSTGMSKENGDESEFDLIKCVGRVEPLAFFKVLEQCASAYSVKAERYQEKSYATENQFDKALLLGEANVYSECSATLSALLKSKDSEETLQYVLNNLELSILKRVAPLDNHDKKFKLGDNVTKTSGSKWSGKVVGFYSTKLTPVGYAVESFTETGSVQIYPEKALTWVDAGAVPSHRLEIRCGGGEMGVTEPKVKLEVSPLEEAQEQIVFSVEGREVSRDLILTPQPDENGWIAHNGKGCPVDGDTVVEVKLRNGIVFTHRADPCDWQLYSWCCDVIAYRIVQSEPETGIHVSEQPKKLKLSAEYCHKEIMRTAYEIQKFKGFNVIWKDALEQAIDAFIDANKAIENNPELMEYLV